MIGLLNQYTESVKEYVPQGQKQSLWEQFLTGTQEAYQAAAQQTQDVYSYDISDAFAKYKQQQLQLQMNEQLGAGFKQQMGSELQSAYGRTYQDIRTQEVSDLSDIAVQYQSTLQKGSEEFERLGEISRKYDKALQEYARLAGISKYEDMTKTDFDEQGNRITELTDYGRLWYQDVLNKEYTDPTTGETIFFEDWLATENTTSEISYKDRLELQKALQQNPELFAGTVTGLTPDFDYSKTKEAYTADITERERVKGIETSESYFLTDKTINNNMSGEKGIGTAEQNQNVSDTLSAIVNEYTTDSLVSVESSYDKQRGNQHTTVVLDYASLTPEQQQAIRDGIGYYADTYLKNGKWTIHLTANGKIGPGTFGMSYSEFIRALKQ